MEAVRRWFGCKEDRVQGGLTEGGQVGRPQKTPPIRREGFLEHIRLYNKRDWGDGRDGRDREYKIVEKKITASKYKIIKGVAVSGRN